MLTEIEKLASESSKDAAIILKKKALNIYKCESTLAYFYMTIFKSLESASSTKFSGVLTTI